MSQYSEFYEESKESKTVPISTYRSLVQDQKVLSRGSIRQMIRTIKESKSDDIEHCCYWLTQLGCLIESELK